MVVFVICHQPLGGFEAWPFLLCQHPPLTSPASTGATAGCLAMVLQILQWLLGVVVVVCFCFTPVLAAAMLSFSCS